MTRGFAVVTYPAEYRQSGVMAFIVNQIGPLLQKDLGNNTDQVASGMREFSRTKPGGCRVIYCSMWIGDVACTLVTDLQVSWSGDWAWGLPLIVHTVMIHVMGFGLVRRKTMNASSRMIHRHPISAFVLVTGLTTLLATTLHALEVSIWALAYRLLGALPDNRPAMLYSLNAMTSYGHVNLSLADHWHLLGAIEALNGWLLFGLSTAWLFAVIERLSSDVRRPRHDDA